MQILLSSNQSIQSLKEKQTQLYTRFNAIGKSQGRIEIASVSVVNVFLVHSNGIESRLRYFQPHENAIRYHNLRELKENIANAYKEPTYKRKSTRTEQVKDKERNGGDNGDSEHSQALNLYDLYKLITHLLVDCQITDCV